VSKDGGLICETPSFKRRTFLVDLNDGVNDVVDVCSGVDSSGDCKTDKLKSWVAVLAGRGVASSEYSSNLANSHTPFEVDSVLKSDTREEIWIHMRQSLRDVQINGMATWGQITGTPASRSLSARYLNLTDPPSQIVFIEDLS